MSALAHDFGQWPARERDAAYDNTAAVRDSAEQLADFDQRSDAFLASAPGQPDLRYGPAERQLFDYFPGRPATATLLFVHGGYWQMRHKNTFRFVLQGAQSRGAHAALIGYSLAPQASLSEIVLQVQQGISAVRQHALQAGSSGDILLCGWSAGGHLTAMCLGCDGVVAGLGISGIYDLAPIQLTYLNRALQLTNDEVERLSPLALPAAHKPFFTAYGTGELPQLQAQSTAFAAHRQHVPGSVLAVQDANHFSILNQLADAKGTLLEPLLAYAGL